jgi:glycerophosphoryl diester phosphodiesterase
MKNKLYFLFFFIIFQIVKLKITRLKRHSFDIFKPNHKIFIDSHRGVNTEFFQNTYLAFKKAIQYNIDGIELDVWLSKDNVPVIVHGGGNGNISGYYNGTGSVKNYTIKELKKFRSVEDNQPIPLLEEVLKMCKNKIFLNIEIKDNRYDIVFNEIIKLLEKYNMFNQIQISSFHHNYYNKVKNYNLNHKKKIEFGFLYINNSTSKFNYNYPKCALNIHYTDVSGNVIKKAHKNKMAVIVWFQMNANEDLKIYKKLFQLGVDGIITNVPNILKLFRDHYYSKIKNK